MQTDNDDQNHVQRIHADPSKKFLSEVFTDLILPFGILNKGKTGCGGTTVAIESPYNYIIFMPTIELINNKLSQYNELHKKTYSNKENDNEISLLGVYGNIAKIKSEIIISNRMIPMHNFMLNKNDLCFLQGKKQSWGHGWCEGNENKKVSNLPLPLLNFFVRYW